MRRFGWLLALLPAVLLAVWLVASQLPTWRIPHVGWFPAEIPGRCAAVASLRAHQGTLTGAHALDAEAARVAGMDAIQTVTAGVFREYGGAIPVQANFVSGSRPAWMMTARGENPGVAPVAVVYVDGETGEILDVIVGLDDPASSCDFNLRRAARDAILSPPFLILAGYTALLVAGGIGWLIIRRRARKG